MAMPPLRIRYLDGIAVVGVGARAAGKEIPPDEGLAECCRQHQRLVLDLTDSDAFTSIFLGHLVRSLHVARLSGCQLRICCPDGMQREPLDVLQLIRILPIFSTLAEALADLDRS